MQNQEVKTLNKCKNKGEGACAYNVMNYKIIIKQSDHEKDNKIENINIQYENRLF